MTLSKDLVLISGPTIEEIHNLNDAKVLTYLREGVIETAWCSLTK